MQALRVRSFRIRGRADSPRSEARHPAGHPPQGHFANPNRHNRQKAKNRPAFGHRNIRHTVRYTASNAARFAGLWERNNLINEKLKREEV